MVKRWFGTFKECGQRLWREKMIKTLLLICKLERLSYSYSYNHVHILIGMIFLRRVHNTSKRITLWGVVAARFDARIDLSSIPATCSIATMSCQRLLACIVNPP